MENKLLREEEIDSRKVWLIQSEAKNDATPLSPSDRQILLSRQLLWIDQQDFAVVRQEVTFPSDLVTLGSQAWGTLSVTSIYSKQGNSIWLPRSVSELKRQLAHSGQYSIPEANAARGIGRTVSYVAPETFAAITTTFYDYRISRQESEARIQNPAPAAMEGIRHNSTAGEIGKMVPSVVDEPDHTSIPREPANEAPTKSDSASRIQKDADAYTFYSGVKEVLVDASVRIKSQSSLKLKKSDFRIFEDSVEKPIVGFRLQETPIAVALVLDRSGSMKDVFTDMQKAATKILSSLKPEDKIALFAFDESIEKLVELTTDHKRIATALNFHEVVGSQNTDIVNALFVSMIYLKQNAPEMRRAIIVVSDNIAAPETTTLRNVRRDEADVIDTAQQSETSIYDLRVPNIWDDMCHPYDFNPASTISMKTITEETGGTMIKASSRQGTVEELLTGLRTRYVLSFTPTTTNSDGRLHTIELRLADRFGRAEKDYSISYRRGYRTARGNRAQ